MSSAVAVATHPRAGRVEPTRLGVRFTDATLALRADESMPVVAEDRLASGERRLGPLELTISMAPGGEVATLEARVRNASERELTLEGVVLGFRWRGHGIRSLRFLKNGWQSWSFSGARELDERGEPEFPSGAWLRGLHHAVSAPPPDRSGWHESALATAVGAAPSGPACVAGVLERGRAFGVVYLRREGEDLLLEVEQRVDALLAPGETRELEPVRVALGDDAGRLLEEHAEAHGRSAGARTAGPFLSGWCSWYHFFHEVSEQDVRRNLDALAASRDALPIDVVQIDDGYQRAVGDWLETNERFPSGLGRLAAAIRSAGFTPGVWTAPFCVVAESALFQKHGEWLLRSQGELFRGLLHPVWSEDASVYVLDPTRPDVLAHLERVFRELVAMGFGYLKLDFLYTVAMRAEARDRKVGRAERLRRGLEAVRAGAGEEAFLLGCGCPLGAAVGVVDGMRVGADVAPAWQLDPGAAIPGIEETQPATRSAVRGVLARAWMHRRLWLNDPDCLMARSRDTDLSAAERRTLAAAIASTGGLAVFSDDVPSLDESSRTLVAQTLALAREVDALGIPGAARALRPLEGEIAQGVVAAGAQGGVLALVNAGDSREERRVDLNALGLAPLAGPPEPLLGSPEARCGEDLRVEVELTEHESALYRLRRAFRLAVFCDFDGTFSVQDVGATLARRYAADRRPLYWGRYQRGQISAWQYNLELLDGLPLPQAELDAFLHTVELDPGAREIVEWCERCGVPFRVLSDGFDYNLNRLQVIHGVRFAYDANRLRYEDGVWRIAGGHPNPDCECGTGTCKRGRIEKFRAAHPGVSVVHIGNGRVSDLCGALAADTVFAKDTLAEELQSRGEAFEPFATLRDVIPRLEQLLERR
ncbi:MAG: alpha-galactosidase [Myxococcota bacterium]